MTTNRIGWAAGTTNDDSDEWFTVWGSALRDDVLYADPADAERRADDIRADLTPDALARTTIVVRYVERVTRTAFRMVDAPALDDHHDDELSAADSA